MKTRFAKWTCLLGLAIGSMGTHASAQATPSNSKPEDVRISLLAIGDRPEITLTTTTKGSFYNKPPETETPPDQLFVKVKNDFKMFMLGLNTPMDAVVHPGNTELKLFGNKDDASDPNKEAYLNIPLPKEKVDLTIFLLRNPSTKNWRSKPVAIPFKNDLRTFPLNATRVINFSNAPIKVKLGEATFDLAARESRIAPYPTTSKGILEYKIGALLKDQAVMVVDSAKSYYPGTRMNLVVYDSDGKKTRQPVEHVIFLEMAQESLPAQEASNNEPKASVTP